MFRRKLLALEHPNVDSVNVNDEKQVRSLVLWLENMKIRHYKIEDRQGLGQLDSPDWDKHFKKYLEDIECPFVDSSQFNRLEWLLQYAVKLEYSDNIEKYKSVTSDLIQQKQSDVPKFVSSNPLDALDFESEDFKNGVQSLAKMLNIANHPDHLVTLEAVSKVICERLNKEALQKPDSFVPQGKPFPFEETSSGLKTHDEPLGKAGKILRMLFIQDLRTLQTSINECIVAAQKVTANPRTDTKLGKVGF